MRRQCLTHLFERNFADEVSDGLESQLHETWNR